MGTQGTGRKRSTKKERSTAEDDALNLIAREAEARLAAKRAARAEAREIRMKELERQQKELSDDDERMSVGSRGSVRVDDKDYLEKGSRAASALTAGTLTSLGGTSSRRGSGETALTVDAETSIRDIKDALAEVEEKYRKAMVSNAQLDNEKNNLMYQVDTLKDSLMELEELLSESRREYEEKLKEFEREKHAHSVLQFQFNEMKDTLKQSEELLNEIRQLRMKQDGFVREISDLQETVEWKDKKIGALERQKEYTDAIRIERDELREEVVQLKDILKKHGIVLGPDLNINGDIGEAGPDGAPGADPAPQSPQDPQSSPTEGNSMLGNTEDLRSSAEEEVAPEQQQEMHEEAKDNHLSSDTLCTDVSLETTSEERPAEEQHTCLSRLEENSLSKDLNVDVTDSPTTEAKDVNVCSPEPVQPATCHEENVPETHLSEGENVKEATNPDLGQTEIKSSRVHTQSDVSEKQGSKEVVVLEEVLPNQSTSSEPNNQTQQEPEKEAENDEAEEEPSKSQTGTASTGKKKKKKKRGKKKGGAHDNKNQQKENRQAEKDRESEVKENGCISESVKETIKESKTETVEDEKNKQGTKDVTSEKQKETTQKMSDTETLKEDVMDHGSNEGQSLKIKSAEEEVVTSPSETVDQGKIDPLIDEQCEEKVPEQTIEPTHDETLKESKKEGPDGQQTLETENEEVGSTQNSEQEAKLSTDDINSVSDEKEVTLSVDDSKGEDTSTNNDIKSESVDQVEEEGIECTTTNSSSNENTEAESHVAADESESTASLSLSPADDITDGLKDSSDPQPSTAMDSGCDDPPVEVSDHVSNEADDQVSTVKTENCVVSPDGDTSEQDGTGQEELNGDKKEPEKEEHVDYVDCKTLQVENDCQVDESTAEMSVKAEDVSQPAEAASSVEQEATAAEDPDHQKDPDEAGSESDVGPESEPLHESDKDKHENNDSAQPAQPISDEEDGEDEEGQSFEFDDMDVEAPAVSDLHSDPEQHPELEEGVEVKLDEGSAGLSQSDAASNGNTQDEPADRTHEDKTCNHVDTSPQEQPNTLAHDLSTSENVDSVCSEQEKTPKEETDPQRILTEEGFSAEAGPSLVEEGVDVVKQELQEENLDLAKSADQVALNKDVPPSGRDVKKSGKKGKGKGKEDCKMS